MLDVSSVGRVCAKHGPFLGAVYSSPSGKQYELACPVCIRERGEAQAARELAASREQERLMKRDVNLSMNIEPAFYEATFDSFVADTAELKHHVERVQALVAGDVTKIIMAGRHGTGKTHLACAALHVLGGKIMTMYEISATIRGSYAAGSERTELEIVDDLASQKLLVIDEIGRTKGSDSEANWLSYIIDKRHVRGLPLILISNKHVKMDCPKSGCEHCFENFIGEDIISRITEGGILLRFTGADWRKHSRRNEP